jgi:hypothetical protein
MYEMTTDNGFLRHNIGHLSPSSLNMSMGSLSAWCVRYLLGQRFPSGGEAERGKAVEIGVSHGLFGQADDKEAVELALETFDRVMQLDDFAKLDKRDQWRAEVEAMVPLALAELRPLGAPTPAPDGTHQHEIGLRCRFAEGEQGVVHIKGFLDFYYADKPLVVDLKTTTRTPSAFSQAHAIQASIYAKARGAPTKFLYVTPKKATWLEITPAEIEDNIKTVKETVKRLERFLSLSEDGKQLTRCAPHDPSSFYWRGADHLLELIA